MFGKPTPLAAAAKHATRNSNNIRKLRIVNPGRNLWFSSVLAHEIPRGLEAIRTGDQFPADLEKRDHFLGGHVRCRAGVKSGFRAKALADRRHQGLAGVGLAGSEHHVHDVMTVDLLHAGQIAMGSETTQSRERWSGLGPGGHDDPSKSAREFRAVYRYAGCVTILRAHRQHARRYEDFRYVYPVLSRRSHGISIGINVNPDKVCNFDCLYCQVDRTVPAAVTEFDLAVAEDELRTLIQIVASGEIVKHPPFDSVPRELLRLNDVALSGDAEPTTLPAFADTIAMIARVKPPTAKIVLITDAGGLGRAEVKRGLEIMDANRGEVWAKLDAGTEAYFKLINRTAIPFERILKNIRACAAARPIVIQSLFLNVRGEPPSPDEIMAYCERLREIGNIMLVQVYTLARRAMTVVDGVPAWQFVSALSHTEVDAIADRVRHTTGLPAESFYGG